MLLIPLPFLVFFSFSLPSTSVALACPLFGPPVPWLTDAWTRQRFLANLEAVMTVTTTVATTTFIDFSDRRLTEPPILQMA